MTETLNEIWTFQFHKGTIRTVYKGLFIMVIPNEFQFHKGTIRTDDYKRMTENLKDFNSIKVQLELRKEMQPTSESKNFNSIKVQLERQQGRSVRPQQH